MELVDSMCSQIAGHTICPFGDALATPATSLMKKFPEEFKDRILNGTASRNPLNYELQ
jgi:NADH:ubiquinone oxidoreductase subunit F (NADH-binding)